MSDGYFDEQIYTTVDFGAESWESGEYVDCTFKNCNMSGLDLSGDTFATTEFIGCDLSMSKLAHTSFKEVHFKDCKLMGLHFDDCNPFLLDFVFEGCVLDFSSFFRLNIKKTRFENCKMEKVDFTQTDLTQSLFKECNLSQAVFDRSGLEKCDFRTAYGYALDPDINAIKGAKFSKEGAIGLLSKYKIDIS
ncbi:pentapeptide repeat-containing protein [Reichenbachiella sp. MSK19-1]|uniref:pentapeptide repeat-containing protein n=1 Tax=Reichenbachiella sp. MSK19-1 TaxID=1897631 RepID=UPI000E6C6CCB|nr:pentapeptide repeat-containing protein [Reichenbachiella sp. MSK19-1]RJE71527.1 hypothetical protein BGP76_05365 [Reichenbachiella sp. MSK19-1]